MEITKPAIVRLSRKSGVKTLSDDCYDTIRHIIDKELRSVIQTMLIVNSERNNKTLMVNDLYDSLKLLNVNLTET